MKLFYTSGACSLSPHIVLREAGLDFTIESVDLASKRTEHGSDYLSINPKGQVPALQRRRRYLFTLLCWAKAMHFDLATWPALADYMARIAARPAVDATLSAEGLK